MRLVDSGQPEQYQPLERGCAFPQYYENGDRYKWYFPYDFHNRYWMYFIQWADCEFGKLHDKESQAEALMMGGEL